MPVNPTDRRSGSEPVEQPVTDRPLQRRMGDRRDSPRLPLPMLVRYAEQGGSFEERQGNVGVGGAFFVERFEPPGRKVELRFRLPGGDSEIRCGGEVLRTSDEGEGRHGVHVRFTELTTDAELAIARFIDNQAMKK